MKTYLSRTTVVLAFLFPLSLLARGDSFPVQGMANIFDPNCNLVADALRLAKEEAAQRAAAYCGYNQKASRLDRFRVQDRRSGHCKTWIAQTHVSIEAHYHCEN